MKVLHLIDSGGLYGAEQVLLTLCWEQRRQGLEPTVLSCGVPDESEKPLEKAAKQQGIPLKVWRMQSGLNTEGIRSILTWAHDEGFNLLHSHGYKFNILLAYASRRITNLPMMTTIHGYVKAPFPRKIWFYEKIDRMALRRLDAVVLVSREMRTMFPREGKVANLITIIHNGIAPLRSERDFHPRRDGGVVKRLLAVGRLSHEKGFDLLIDAIAALHKMDSCFSLTLMGEGRLQKDLLKQVEVLGLQDVVIFSGYKEAAWQYYADYDALVMPSRTEGIPITILEALRAGMPTFATRVGGIPEVLGRHSPLLIEPESVSDIVSKIIDWNCYLKEDRKKYIEMLRTENYSQFKSESMARSYSEIYCSLNRKNR